ncbi:phage tail protein [Yersinia sp. 1652 StPb PI]|uniref:gp53-like domain-containing protein n=1 Tax=Yersinia sp. 1652 StPb PI TaxID=3061649 RepID=UPI00355ADFED
MQKIGDIPNSRADSNGEFTDGNVAGGVPPTILPAEWFNTLQRELMSVLSAANIDADSEKFDQVATAVSKLITDGGFLKTANNLVEIKNAGPAAVAETLVNLGLGDAAKRNVGTGVNQIPDMASFAASPTPNGYQKLPGGIIIQFGSASGSQVVNLPIVFPSNALVAFASSGTPSAYATTGIFTKTTLQVVSATGGAIAWIAIGC